MILAMVAALVLLLVFSMGTVLMELLFADAPRRGKRPDIHDDSPNSEPVLRVITSDGDMFVGMPLAVVRDLIAEGYSPAPRLLTSSTAEILLLEWEKDGRVRIRGEWRKI